MTPLRPVNSNIKGTKNSGRVSKGTFESEDGRLGAVYHVLNVADESVRSAEHQRYVEPRRRT